MYYVRHPTFCLCDFAVRSITFPYIHILATAHVGGIREGISPSSCFYIFVSFSLSLFKILLCEHGTCWGKEEKGKNLPNQISIFSNGSLLMPWWEMMFFSRSRAPLLSLPLYPVFLFSHLDRVSMLKSTNPSWQRASCVSDVHRLLRDVEIGARESQENTKKKTKSKTTQSIEIGLLVEKKMKINPKKERESERI